MRASSLSNERVIGLLARYFVPVWISNDDYQLVKKSQTDAEELRRIRQTSERLGMEVGQVTVYLVHPDGMPLATSLVDHVTEPEGLYAMLQKVVARLCPPARDTAALFALRSNRRAAPRPGSSGSLLLQISTRYLPPGPAEQGAAVDWVELSPAEWSAFLPPAGTKRGTSWSVPPGAVERISRYFFPVVVTYEPEPGGVKTAAWRATFSMLTPEFAQIDLHGIVHLEHSRDGKTDGTVNAQLVGVIRYDLKGRTISSFQMVSEGASYVWHHRGKPQRSRLGIIVELLKAGSP
jgi:hypothetical protein